MFGIFKGLGNAITGGLFGLGSALLGAHYTRKNNADNQQLSWNMWHANNAYNDSAAQMARFRAAGLNPNLIYGQMSNSPPPVFARGEAPDMSSVADAIRDATGFELKERELAQNAALQYASLEAMKERSAADRHLRERELSMQERMLPYRIKEIETENAVAMLKLDDLLDNRSGRGGTLDKINKFLESPLGKTVKGAAAGVASLYGVGKFAKAAKYGRAISNLSKRLKGI